MAFAKNSLLSQGTCGWIHRKFRRSKEAIDDSYHDCKTLHTKTSYGNVAGFDLLYV